MAQPTILNAGSDNTTSDSTVYASDFDTGTTRQFSSITIPEAANTAILHTGIHNAADARTIDTLIVTGSGSVAPNFIPVAASSAYRGSRIAVMDVSSLGAFTCTVTTTLSSSSTQCSLLAVVCTDGFLENMNTAVDAAVVRPRHVMHSANYENNILLVTAFCDTDITGQLTTNTGTALFEATDGLNQSTSYAYSQATNSGTIKTIEYTCNTVNNPDSSLGIFTLCSQEKVFEGAGTGGGVIRSVIRNI